MKRRADGIQQSLFSRTSTDSSAVTEDEILLLFSQGYGTAGLLSRSESSTPSFTASLSEGDECSSSRTSLRSVLESDVPRTYWLSAKACAGILRRAANRGKDLPPLLKAALEWVASRSDTTRT